MLSIYSTLILEDANENEFDSFREEYYILKEEEKKEKGVKKVASKVDKGAQGILKMIRSLHTTNDKNLIENMPEFSKIITRAIMVGGAWVINPTVGLITLFTTLVMKARNDTNKRDKLLRLYSGKLEYIEDKLGRVDEDKEKYELIKLKNKLKSDINKLKVLKDTNHED